MAVFGVALAATAAAVVTERRAAEPIMPPWFWSSRVFAGSGVGALGLGLLVIGPSTFLPTYGQEVLGLGAVAAGAVLATMSLGWPLASSQSARFFLRIGFRDTAAIGAGICLAGVSIFAFAPDHRTVWLPVASTFVLGFGLGLLSVCTVVGPQSTVTWNQRGVVTGAIMFCRYLGQSLGAAIFGAIFNAVLLQWLRAAPPALRGALPGQVNGISRELAQPGQLTQAAVGYLRDAIAAGTKDIYVGLAAIAAVTLLAVLVIIPRRFATRANDETDVVHGA